MKKIKLIIIIGILTGFLFWGQSLFFNNNKFIKDSGSFIVRPVGSVFSTIGWWIRDKVIFLATIGDLKKNNQVLFDINLKLKAEIAKTKEVEKENEILRTELAIIPREKYKLESAMIIGRKSGASSEVVYIGKGDKHGIKQGMAVLAGEGVLVGVVTESNSQTSRIKLVTDKKFKVNVKLVESNGHGILQGQYGTSAVVKMIPQTVKIAKGDTVVTSELSDALRENLLVGYVQEVLNTSDGLFQEVIVALPKDLKNLHLVHVLLNNH